ncbi:hypothetical protein CEP52_016391 [Fusarium oligoseptatum]|uniref:ribonuclease H n=1 Tax=Fusarium oligoseptatum TaxID=2604345 RepID=A0A428S485_9HYPO|nr:hypothetical protein CEP52_016391 [Fusarium oligoseptatum]
MALWRRFSVTQKILELNTIGAISNALERFEDLLLERRSDYYCIRDIIPHILLRLGREQECYDFLKWWANIDDKDHFNGEYDWNDETLPFLDIRGADPFEPLNKLRLKALSVSQLVALTLLKWRLCVDIGVYPEDHEFLDPGKPLPVNQRPVGRLARAKMQTLSTLGEVEDTFDMLEEQFRKLFRMVNDSNLYLWAGLVKQENPSLPTFHPPRSMEEADLVLWQCLRAWQETTGAIDAIDEELSELTPMAGGTHGVSRVLAADGTAVLRSEEDEETEVLPRERGTGRVFPKRFKPPKPTSKPAKLFQSVLTTDDEHTTRFVHYRNGGKVLVYAHGTCLVNDQMESSAGWAVVFAGPETVEVGVRSVASGRLENKGPFGDDDVATSNRAELRAAVAALRVCDWKEEDFDMVVIATDSSYVVEGATSWVKNWVRNGWKTRIRKDVRNKDLWELLLGDVERWKQQKVTVYFWEISREDNADADAAAKEAAQNGTTIAEFKDITAASPQTGMVSGEMVSCEMVDGKLLPRMLVLCLEYESAFDTYFKSLVSELKSKAKMERANAPKAALAILGQKSPPSIILVADGGIAKDREVRTAVINHLRRGARVVLAGCFSRLLAPERIDRFFSVMGLPWQTAGLCRQAQVNLTSAYLGDYLLSRLTPSYNQKALFLRHISKDQVWYTDPRGLNDVAVACADVGLGKLGYIGDVNGEEPSIAVVLGLCGLLRSPDSLIGSTTIVEDSQENWAIEATSG